MSMTLEIRSSQQSLRVPRARIQAGVVAAFRQVRRRKLPLLSIAVVDDVQMAELHRRHLGKTGPTDVLSFPLYELDEALEQGLPFGEVVVSADTAIRQARERGHPPSFELCLYVVHGVLHLLGFDDHSLSDRRRMREAEARCLRAARIERSLWGDED